MGSSEQSSVIPWLLSNQSAYYSRSVTVVSLDAWCSIAFSQPSTATACFGPIFHDRMIAFSPCCCFKKGLWKMFHKIFFCSFFFSLFALWVTPVYSFHVQHEIRFFRNYTACQLCIRAICHLHIGSTGCCLQHLLF